MPNWTEPTPDAQIQALRHDLRAAAELYPTLPAGSKDARMVAALIERLQAELTTLVAIERVETAHADGSSPDRVEPGGPGRAER